jgi:hypothetical protein
MGNGDAATGHETGHGQRGQGARLIWVRRGSSWGGCTRAVSLTSNLQLVKSENPRVLLTWEYLVLEPGSDVCRLGPSSADYAARHVWPSQETTRSVAVGNSGERPPPTEGSVDEPMDSLSVCRCSLRSPGQAHGGMSCVAGRPCGLWRSTCNLALLPRPSLPRLFLPRQVPRAGLASPCLRCLIGRHLLVCVFCALPGTE